MEEKEILQALKDNEHLDIKQVAKLLDLPSSTVMKAQLSMTKRCVKRDSLKWELVNYGR